VSGQTSRLTHPIAIQRRNKSRSRASRRVPRSCHSDDLDPVSLSELANGHAVTSECRLERRLLLPFRILRCHLRQAIEGKHSLRVQGMLGPKRTVLIKRSDAIGRLNILATGLFGRVPYEIRGSRVLQCRRSRTVEDLPVLAHLLFRTAR
jgi:hypothetical protein